MKENSQTKIDSYQDKDVNELAEIYRTCDNFEKHTIESLVCDKLKPMIMSLAGKSAKYNTNMYNDMIMEGSLAGLDALRVYDPERGAKFTTFAYSKINNAIYNTARKNSFSGRSQSYTASEIKKYKTAKIEMQNELNRTPTIDEIAERLNKKPKTILEYERKFTN